MSRRPTLQIRDNLKISYAQEHLLLTENEADSDTALKAIETERSGSRKPNVHKTYSYTMKKGRKYSVENYSAHLRIRRTRETRL